jgi:hypothetical protein
LRQQGEEEIPGRLQHRFADQAMLMMHISLYLIHPLELH